jgi:hypothetical protein
MRADHFSNRIGAWPVVAALVVSVLAACSSAPAGASQSPPPTSATAPGTVGSANNPAPCTMATASELSAAIGVEFAEGTPGTIPGVPPIPSCEWLLVPKDLMDAHEGYVLIAFMPYGLDKARIVDAGHDATVGGRAAIIGSGDSNGVASIEVGSATVLRVEMTLGPGPRERYAVLTSDVIDDVAEVAARHL